MVVYRLTCRVTGKSYIGATQSLRKRLNNHRATANAGGLKGMYPIAVAIREHGWDSFDVDVLSRAKCYDELIAMEKAAITLHRTMLPNGYNQMAGGGGCLYEPPKGKRPWNRGVPHRLESREKMSAVRRGAKNYRARPLEYQGITYGCMEECLTATGLTRGQLMLRMDKGWGTYLTPGSLVRYGAHPPVSNETRGKMSAAHSGAKHYRARRILVNGVEYPSIKDAEGVSGFTRQQLKLRLKDGRATYLSDSHYVKD